MSETELQPAAPSPTSYRDRLIVLGLVLITLACYWPVGMCDFVNYDDPRYITNNIVIQRGITWEGVTYAMTSSDDAYWHPLTWMSHMLDVELYGPKLVGRSLVGSLLHTDDAFPAGHHFTNLIFHLANVVLLWILLKQMIGSVWVSAWVAAMFGVHPMHVESVAWICERKDVLSGLFFLLTLLAYHRYIRTRTWSRYVLIMLAFAAALMSKPSTVTTPFVLLLLDIWPLRRIELGRRFWRSAVRPLVEKLPLFLLSAGSCAITFYGTASLNGIMPLEMVPLSMRLETSVISYARYLGKLFWPTNMVVYYPTPDAWPVSWTVGSTVLFLAITALAIWQLKRRPYLLVGWLWFVGIFIPMIGLIVAGDASLNDRFTYLPYIGPFIVIALLTVNGFGKYRTALWIAGVTSVLACVGLTYQQVGYWQNSFTLMGHALKVDPKNWTANVNYASTLISNHRAKEAEPYFKTSLKSHPKDNWQADIAYARWLLDAGRIQDAAPLIQAAAEVDPGNYNYLILVARVQATEGDYAHAIPIFNYVLKHKPLLFEAETHLAISLETLGHFPEAEQHYRRALQINPSLELCYYRLGQLIAGDRPMEAIECFKAALNNAPDMGVAHLAYGIMLANGGQYEGSLQELARARATLSEQEVIDRCRTEMAYGQVLEKGNQPLEAAGYYVKAVEIIQAGSAKSPEDPAIACQLALTLKEVGRQSEAAAAADRAMAIAVAHPDPRVVATLRHEFPAVATQRSNPGPATAPAMHP